MNLTLEQWRIAATIASILALVFFVLHFHAWSALGTAYSRNRKAKEALDALRDRCEAITEAAGAFWPDLTDLRGEQFTVALTNRIREAAAMHGIIFATFNTEDRKGHFDPIEELRRGAAMITELNRVEDALERWSERGLELNPEHPIADKVSAVCATLHRLSKLKGISGHHVTGHLVWMPSRLEETTVRLVRRFANAVAGKLFRSQEKRTAKHFEPAEWAFRNSEWPIPEAQESLLSHIAKGDPLDVAIYAAFLWHHGERTSLLNYMSVTPALEQAIKMTLSGVNMESLNKLAETKLKPTFRVADCVQVPPMPPNEARPGQLEGSEEIPVPEGYAPGKAPCPYCHAMIPKTVPGGLCPACGKNLM